MGVLKWWEVEEIGGKHTTILNILQSEKSLREKAKKTRGSSKVGEAGGLELPFPPPLRYTIHCTFCCKLKCLIERSHHFKRAHYAPINVNPVRVGSMGKGWGFEQKEKHLVHFLWVGNWVQTSNIAKNPPHPPRPIPFMMNAMNLI